MPINPHLACLRCTWLLPVAALFLTACQDATKDTSLLVSAAPSVFEDVLLVDGVADAVQSTIVSCPEDIESDIVFIVEDGARVDSGQVLCILESAEMASDFENLQLSLERFEAALVKSKTNLANQYAILEAQVKSLDAQTAIANLDSLQLLYLSPRQRRLKELDIERAAIERNKITKRLEALETINRSELRKQELQIARWARRIESAKEKMDQLTIRATQPGLAIRAESWLTGEKVKEGDQAWSGMPLVKLPDPSRMKVVIEATETQFKQINLNDSLEFTFDAMPGKKAWGRITSMTPIGRPVSRGSKVKVFDLEASIDSAMALPEPGLSVNCRVFLKRLPNVIVLPQLALFDVDSLKVVYVKKGKHYEQRQVMTGTSSPKLAVIVAGLTGKESVSLLKPSASRIKRQVRLPDSIVRKYAAPVLPAMPTPPNMPDMSSFSPAASQATSSQAAGGVVVSGPSRRPQQTNQ